MKILIRILVIPSLIAVFLAAYGLMWVFRKVE